MYDLEHLKILSNKQIYASVLLDIYRMIPIKSGLSYDEYNIEIIKRLKFENIGDNKKLRDCVYYCEWGSSSILVKAYFSFKITDA